MAAPVISYFLARLAAYYQLVEPSSLADVARRKFRKHPEYRLITFGHTHNPEQFVDDGRSYYNTGTWIPIVETSYANIREDRTYTFLDVTRDSEGHLRPVLLQRWNDDAGRPECLPVVAPKDQ